MNTWDQIHKVPNGKPEIMESLNYNEFQQSRGYHIYTRTHARRHTRTHIPVNIRYDKDCYKMCSSKYWSRVTFSGVSWFYTHLFISLMSVTNIVSTLC